MAQPINPNSGLPPRGDDRRRVEHQETLLLTDVPEAAAMVPERPAPVPMEAGTNLNPATLAALSQRYDILASAGHGSMGNVYKARDRETGEVVALKLLKPEIASDQTMMERFKNELLFARKITHKNVCRVHEFNRIGGIAYTSMEFVEGESLRSVLNRFGGLPPRKAIDLVHQICSGLKEAHAQGIVHRDLKPENVMIDAQGNVKIMDFGIARSMEAVTRLTGSMVGTPAYMAPEQVAGKPVDYRTDIYSLGLIMY
jgi:serine/threonine protein kinase